MTFPTPSNGSQLAIQVWGVSKTAVFSLMYEPGETVQDLMDFVPADLLYLVQQNGLQLSADQLLTSQGGAYILFAREGGAEAAQVHFDELESADEEGTGMDLGLHVWDVTLIRLETCAMDLQPLTFEQLCKNYTDQGAYILMGWLNLNRILDPDVIEDAETVLRPADSLFVYIQI